MPKIKNPINNNNKLIKNIQIIMKIMSNQNPRVQLANKILMICKLKRKAPLLLCDLKLHSTQHRTVERAKPTSHQTQIMQNPTWKGNHVTFSRLSHYLPIFVLILSNNPSKHD